MPSSKSSSKDSVKVTLHVYDFLEQGLNGLLRQVGTGGFHCGVEVFGKEWSFRRTYFGTGLFWINPRTCTAHVYRESVPMGTITMTVEAFNKLIEELKVEWPGNSYDILKRNCCVFSNEFCKRLGAGPIPGWILSLPDVGAQLRSVVRRPLRQVEGAIFPETKQKAEMPPQPRPPVPQGPKRSRERPEALGYEELKTPKRRARWGSSGPLTWKIVTVLVAVLLILPSCCALAVATGRVKVMQITGFLRSSGFQKDPTEPVPVPAPAPGMAEAYLPGQAVVGTPSPYTTATLQPASGSDSKPLFDCVENYATWRVDWSPEKLGWCCMQADTHCPVRKESLHDCDEGYADWRNAWSMDKQRWCCKHGLRGCPSNATGSATRNSTHLRGGNGSRHAHASGGAYADHSARDNRSAAGNSTHDTHVARAAGHNKTAGSTHEASRGGHGADDVGSDHGRARERGGGGPRSGNHSGGSQSGHRGGGGAHAGRAGGQHRSDEEVAGHGMASGRAGGRGRRIGGGQEGGTDGKAHSVATRHGHATGAGDKTDVFTGGGKTVELSA